MPTSTSSLLRNSQAGPDQQSRTPDTAPRRLMLSKNVTWILRVGQHRWTRTMSCLASSASWCRARGAAVCRRARTTQTTSFQVRVPLPLTVKTWKRPSGRAGDPPVSHSDRFQYNHNLNLSRNWPFPPLAGTLRVRLATTKVTMNRIENNFLIEKASGPCLAWCRWYHSVNCDMLSQV